MLIRTIVAIKRNTEIFHRNMIIRKIFSLNLLLHSILRCSQCPLIIRQVYFFYESFKFVPVVVLLYFQLCSLNSVCNDCEWKPVCAEWPRTKLRHHHNVFAFIKVSYDVCGFSHCFVFLISILEKKTLLFECLEDLWLK